jgi:hypothetical protein
MPDESIISNHPMAGLSILIVADNVFEQRKQRRKLLTSKTTTSRKPITRPMAQ